MQHLTSLFAHVGEEHATTADSAMHALFGQWYIALPLFILVLFAVGSMTYVLSKRSKPATFTTVLIALFVIGVLTYTVSALISAIAISLGFLLVLVQVLATLSHPK
jgi:CHASE2 domain-containing sensor protein